MQAALAPSAIRIKEIGKVKAVKKIIARVSGLSNFMNGQLVNFGDGSPTKWVIVGFQEEVILVLILGEENRVRIGQEVYSAQEELRIPVGEGFLGRVVSAVAEPVDGKGPIAVNGSASQRVSELDPPTRQPANPLTQ